MRVLVFMSFGLVGLVLSSPLDVRDASSGVRDAPWGVRDASSGVRDASWGVRDASDGQYFLQQTSCTQCVCGVPTRWTRIVGGAETEVNEYPWMVALSKNGKFFCGGTLINDRYVLTAAHCVASKKLVDDMRVILSAHNTADMAEGMSETHFVDEVVRHPDYKPIKTLDNDLALIRLAIPVVFRTGIVPACLPPPDVDFAEHVGTVAGWGLLAETGPSPGVLHAVQVPILTHEKCLMTDYTHVEVTGNMFCAGNLEHGGVDSCRGDSGGALFIEDPMMRTIAAGIVSWGNGCAKPNRPGVYTRVNRYLQWIADNTRDACACL